MRQFHKPNFARILRVAAALAGVFALASAPAQNLTLRIVTYNIEDDITNSTFHTNATTPLPGLIFPVAGGSVTSGGALEGIGEEILADGVARSIDILALEETSGPSTVQPIVAGLNAYYGQFNPLASNLYATSPYQATESGGATNDGNGPNAVVYNTKTVQLIASTPVDPVGGTGKLGSSSGEYREVVRYEFAPAAQAPTSSTVFYLYVSHYKSGTTSTDTNDRAGEAAIIRTNEAILPAGARVLYVGDYNISTSSEPCYQTIIAVNSPNGVAQGQGFDPFNPNGTAGIDWTANTLLNEKSEEDFSLHYRDDFQIGTANIYNATAGGLALVPGTYHTFANNGSVAYENSVDNGTDTALNGDLAPGSTLSASQLYADLVGASDHLPVVADYTIPVNPPGASFTAGTATSGLPPLTVTFTDASSGIVTNWFWDFGDGATSNTITTLNVTHTYTAAGVYTVSETVTGPGGVNTATQNSLITVLTPFQAWQLQYFGCTNCPQAEPGADADGTGQDNQFKFVAGLDPTNPASIFTFTAAPHPAQPSWIDLNFSPVAAGRSYTILYNSNLTTANWIPLVIAPSFEATNGLTVTLTDTNTSPAQKYYEVEISAP